MNNQEAREFIEVLSEGYKKRRKNNNLSEDTDFVPVKIIEIYHKSVEKPHFKNLVETYKKKYIYNEARIEKNISREEQRGLGEVYDYVSNFDYEKDNFNIFICAMLIHQKLYSKCPDSSFGGTLRDDQAILKGTYIDVTPGIEAQKYFNSFIGNSNFIFEPLKDDDIFSYIKGCIIVTVKLIKAQPFIDGNKRTFRALLNLMLKRINIPPIYIEIEQMEEYKKALFEAMINENYESIIRFYYYKICDAIVELDVKNSELREKTEIVFK